MRERIELKVLDYSSNSKFRVTGLLHNSYKQLQSIIGLDLKSFNCKLKFFFKKGYEMRKRFCRKIALMLICARKKCDDGNDLRIFPKVDLSCVVSFFVLKRDI